MVPTDPEELKKVHGEDVELGVDDSEDEHLTEKKALEQAKAEGIEFVDSFTIEGDEKRREFKTRAAAEKEADGRNIIQTRTRKQ